MGFFHKNKHKEEVVTSTDTTAEDLGRGEKRSFTTEELARQWWAQKYGEEMPEPVAQWFKQLTSVEARRLTIAMQLLTPQQLLQKEEAKRLATTKLQSTEEAMMKVRAQEDWLVRYCKAIQDLDIRSKHLYEVNKTLAICADEEKDLERYEAIETVRGQFLRMKLSEKMGRENKQALSLLTRQYEEAQHQAQSEQKLMVQKDGALADAEKHMALVSEQMNEAYRVLGARSVIDLDLQAKQTLLKDIEQRQANLAKSISEQEEEIASLQEQIRKQTTQKQSLEPHNLMLSHGEQILTMLNQLSNMKEDADGLSRQHEEAQKKLREANETLSQLGGQSKGIETEVLSLMQEMQMHRQNIVGNTNHSLQERAAELKRRRQMLQGAQLLWERIKEGYRSIEEKTLHQNSLRLSIENLQNSITKLCNEIEKLKPVCQEREYMLNMSKSQNVILLRGDLREGASCMVCGATHHPFHSGTMLEQNKLINEVHIEFKQEQTLLQGKEKQLLQMRLELSARQKEYELEETYLRLEKLHQENNVKEWSLYAELDKSFADCTPTTNQEARTSMIRQLIENTVLAADDAQRELDTYNYHQNRINDISEKLTQKEQEKSELNVRLNEARTNCQVQTALVERIQQETAKNQSRYTEVYDALNKAISLPDWFKEWSESHEALKLRISQMISEWKTLNEDIESMQTKQAHTSVSLNEKQAMKNFVEETIQQIQDDIEQRNTLRKEGEQTLERTIGDKEPKEYFDVNNQAKEDAAKEVASQRIQVKKANDELATIEGRLQEIQRQGKELDEQTVNEQSQLDIWLRTYNVSHQPIQYNELERSFTEEKDWNATRKRVREVRVEAAIEKTLVDMLRQDIVRLQSEGPKELADNKEQGLAQLKEELNSLLTQYREISVQYAEQVIALRKHEQCKARIDAEQQTVQSLLSK